MDIAEDWQEPRIETWVRAGHRGFGGDRQPEGRKKREGEEVR